MLAEEADQLGAGAGAGGIGVGPEGAPPDQPCPPWWTVQHSATVVPAASLWEVRVYACPPGTCPRMVTAVGGVAGRRSGLSAATT
jgi:hypothetical protein